MNLTTPIPSTTKTTPFLSPSSLSFSKRRRFRVSVPRNSSTRATPPPPPSTSTSTTSTTTATNNIFGGKRELTGIQPLVETLSPPARLAASAVILAGAVASGYGLGLRLGGSRNLAIGGGAAAGAAGAAAVFAFNGCVPEVVAVSLHNYVAGFDDPRDVKKEEIEQIAKKSVSFAC